MSEFYKITNTVYNVKNEDGVKDAIYDYFDVGTYSMPKKRIDELRYDKPPYLPITIVINGHDWNSNRLYIDFFNIHEAEANSFN